MSKRYVIVTVIFLGTLPALFGGWALNQAIYAQEKDRANKAIAMVQEDDLRARVNGCESTGNVVAGVIQLSAQAGDKELSESRRIMPIINCEATFQENSGFPVPLSDEIQDKYIDYLARGRVPILNGDRIVASRVPNP